jgi:hypothetical protein
MSSVGIDVLSIPPVGTRWNLGGGFPVSSPAAGRLWTEINQFDNIVVTAVLAKINNENLWVQRTEGQ